MSSLLGNAAGERMELSEYYADIDRHYATATEFWKLERGQSYAEPEDESWRAFDRGDWDEALRLVEDRREWLTGYFARNAERGLASRRIRIVSLPPTPYLQWELHGLRLRDELGQDTRVLLAGDVAAEEVDGPLPDLNLLVLPAEPQGVAYQVRYDDSGVASHTLRYCDPALVDRCRALIGSLYDRGEPLASFFDREIAPLTPPLAARRSIPHDYLDQAGRPVPPRS